MPDVRSDSTMDPLHTFACDSCGPRKLLREALQTALSKLRAEEEAATQEASMPAYGSQVLGKTPEEVKTLPHQLKEGGSQVRSAPEGRTSAIPARNASWKPCCCLA
eukprot:222147-Pelagomonas_calceolata.AAC.3